MCELQSISLAARYSSNFDNEKEKEEDGEKRLHTFSIDYRHSKEKCVHIDIKSASNSITLIQCERERVTHALPTTATRMSIRDSESAV